MKISLIYQVILAIVLGIVVGLFFGPYCSFLDTVGEIFFMLLQMVVLPYLLFLLIQGLGSLSGEIALKLFKRGWIFFVLLWAGGFGVVYILLKLIPSPHLVFVEPTATGSDSITMNILSYLIPRNIFYDLTNNIVPAITVCGLISGLAVMNIEKKDYILNFLSQVNTGIEKILQWLAKVSPIAIFAHVAYTTGTLHFENLAKLEICIAVYIIGSLFLTFWFLPALLTSLTDMSYKEVMTEFRNVCLIPFATGMPSLAFPFIYLSLKKMARRHEIESPHFNNTAQAVLPLSFTFGQLGNFFVLFFIVFLSFYTHHPLTSAQEYFLMVLILPMSFGTIFSSINSVIFLIDKFQFPEEAFHVFLTTSAITMNFQVLLSAASIVTLVILVLHAFYGLLKVKWKKLISSLAIAFVVFGAIIAVAKPFIKFQDNFTYLYKGLQVSKILHNMPDAKVYHEGQTAPLAAHAELPPLDRVLKSGVLRVGYFPMDTPFCYFNRFGELSGYDVSFAYQLARDLDCEVVFIPIDLMRIGEQLKNAEYDVAMSALVMSEERLTSMDFVKPNFEENNVLIVPLSKRQQFLNLDDVTARQGLKIGGIGAYYDTLKRHFPLADAVPLNNFRALMDKEVDAVLWSYLSAFVWCLSNPEFTIVDYQGKLGKHFFSYAVRESSGDWIFFLQNWLILKDQQGFSSEMYNYWILGQLPQSEHQRWSIINNVLHWVAPRPR